ncbi:MAG: tight adherence protein [Actinomycetota bacterium]|nr:tight adherence protein [Actinomycetota bacterium]
MPGGVLVGVGMALVGMSVMVLAIARGRRLTVDLGRFLTVPEDDGFGRKMAEPFLPRMVAMARQAMAVRLERLVPRRHLEKIEHQLALAGLAGQRRAGEQLAVQVMLTVGLGVVAALLLGLGLSPKARLVVMLLPVIGFIAPSARLKRQIRGRSDAIFKDLPDIIDMMAIAVEAGCGFDAALSIVCQHFESPMADELRRALQEMELGKSRKEALQELKRRTEIDVVRTFVLALVQADALGIPIGRVLTSQATEVRSRRRAWAREKAAKLPIKIMFPLVLFIFPPILAIVIGPAIGSFRGL